MEPWATPFPLELVIQGTPVALGESSSFRNRWKAKVKANARARLREVGEWEWLDERRVAVTIFYFLDAEMQGDIDNIVNPILDAIVYPDDRVVERVLAQRFEPGRQWQIETDSVQMVKALAVAPPAVYIRVDDDLSWRLVS